MAQISITIQAYPVVGSTTIPRGLRVPVVLLKSTRRYAVVGSYTSISLAQRSVQYIFSLIQSHAMSSEIHAHDNYIITSL